MKMALDKKLSGRQVATVNLYVLYECNLDKEKHISIPGVTNAL